MQPETGERDNRNLAREIDDLRREIRTLYLTIERQSAANQQFSRRVEELARLTEEIVQSRIWRVLAAAGGAWLKIAKRLPRRKGSGARVRSYAATDSYRRWIQEFESGQRATVSPPAGFSIAVRRIDRAEFQTSTTEYVALMDAGDTLAPNALAEAAEWIRENGPVDVLYSDEDRVDARGVRSNPFFKPDWSPELFLSTNYTGGFLVVRTARALESGGIDDSGAYGLLLRMMAKGASVGHVPKVLVHRSQSSPFGTVPQRRALQAYLDAASPGAYAEDVRTNGTFRIRYPIPAGTRVSIIIPSGGNREMLQRNLDGIAGRTDYGNYELIIVDNSSGDAIRELAESRGARWVDWRRKPFNFSEICNEGAGRAASPLLLFLNDDAEPLNAGWLRALTEQACRPEIGAVGAKLLFADGTIQHAGVVVGLFGRSGHAFKHLRADQPHYHNLADSVREVSAVTGACLMMRSEVFQELGGFDGANFPVDSNDIDLCLRARKAGYRVLYTPFAELRHDEAVSKSPTDLRAHPAEIAAFHERWRSAIERDPFYSPHLTRDAEDFSIRLSR